MFFGVLDHLILPLMLIVILMLSIPTLIACKYIAGKIGQIILCTILIVTLSLSILVLIGFVYLAYVGVLGIYTTREQIEAGRITYGLISLFMIVVNIFLFIGIFKLIKSIRR